MYYIAVIFCLLAFACLCLFLYSDYQTWRSMKRGHKIVGVVDKFIEAEKLTYYGNGHRYYYCIYLVSYNVEGRFYQGKWYVKEKHPSYEEGDNIDVVYSVSKDGIYELPNVYICDRFKTVLICYVVGTIWAIIVLTLKLKGVI